MDAEHEESSADLAGIIDEFLDWADDAERLDALRGLPKLGAQEHLGPGSRLGDFLIVRLLGSGGMGRVFEARQVSVEGRRVALKVLRMALSDEQALTRFSREVAAIASLSHEGIVPVLAADVTGDLPYYAMSYVEGVSCSRFLKELRTQGDSPSAIINLEAFLARLCPPTEGREHSEDLPRDYARWVATFFAELCEALAHAHAAGVFHRDVKPGNVMVTREGRAVLLDFGLASRYGDDSLTVSGAFIGTLAYCAPEQARGQATDARSDVYSVGAMLYEFITLRKPFETTQRAELLRGIEYDDPPSMGSAVPFDLKAICQCAMSKSPSRRYSSAAQMARDLRAHLAGETLAARGRPLWYGGWLHARRHPLVAAGLLALLVWLGSGVLRLNEANSVAQAGSSLSATYFAELANANAMRVELDERLDQRAAGANVDLYETNRLRTRLVESITTLETRHEEAEGTLLRSFGSIAGHSGARRELANLHAARLTFALENAWDVLRPRQLEEIEKRLAEYDDEGLHDRLLDGTGSMHLECKSPGARLALIREADGVLVASSGFPFESSNLEEGTYRAHIEAPGLANCMLPILIRRHAVYERELARPDRTRSVQLFPHDEIGEGWVVVPAGWTLVEDSPPRWTHVDTFMMQRLEVCFEEYIDWMNAIPGSASLRRLTHRQELTPDGSPFLIPQDGSGKGSWLLDHDEQSGKWSMPSAESARIPVRGLMLKEMVAYATSGGVSEIPMPAGWFTSLPSIEQWRRAARGADGRLYPWGNDAPDMRCSWLLADEEPSSDPSPHEIGTHPGDRSPFGVLDMAGSIREATNSLAGNSAGSWGVCGGSYRTADPAELRISTVHSDISSPRWDTGMRLIKTARDAFFLPAPVASGSFTDDFERADSEELGNGWRRLSLFPGERPSDPNAKLDVRIEEGKLICTGGLGNGSQHSRAVRRIAPGREGFDVQAVLSARSLTKNHGRTHGFTLRDRLGSLMRSSVGIRLNEYGRLNLTVAGYENQVSAPGAVHDPLEPKRFTIRWRPGLITGEVTALDGTGAVRLQVKVEEDIALPGYLVLSGSNLSGMSLIVEEVSVLPATD